MSAPSSFVKIFVKLEWCWLFSIASLVLGSMRSAFRCSIISFCCFLLFACWRLLFLSNWNRSKDTISHVQWCFLWLPFDISSRDLIQLSTTETITITRTLKSDRSILFNCWQHHNYLFLTNLWFDYQCDLYFMCVKFFFVCVVLIFSHRMLPRTKVSCFSSCRKYLVIIDVKR